MIDTTTGVPDLLQRFVETPFSTTVAIDGAEITLQSNAQLDGVKSQARGDNFIPRLTATIVHDPEAPTDNSRIAVIKSWPVATVLAGTGTILALDCERCDILGFLAPTVSSERLLNELLPIVVGLYREFQTETALRSV